MYCWDIIRELNYQSFEYTTSINLLRSLTHYSNKDVKKTRGVTTNITTISNYFSYIKKHCTNEIMLVYFLVAVLNY